MGGVLYPEWRLPRIAEMRRSWSKFLVFGTLLIALGVACLIYAVTTTLASVVVLGWILIFGGIIEASLTAWARRWSGFLLHLLGGILSVFVGAEFVANPGLGAVTLTLLLATFLIVAGAFRIVGSALIRSGDWGWMLVNGLISVFLGILILAKFPAAAALLLGLFIGIELIARGMSLVMLSLTVRKIVPEPARG